MNVTMKKIGYERVEWDGECMIYDATTDTFHSDIAIAIEAAGDKDPSDHIFQPTKLEPVGCPNFDDQLTEHWWELWPQEGGDVPQPSPELLALIHATEALAHKESPKVWIPVQGQRIKLGPIDSYFAPETT